MQIEESTKPALKFWQDRIFWVVLAISAPVLLLVLIEPLNFDNAIYQSMALDLLRHGRIPYIGSFDQNFPGIVYIHCFAILLYGSSDLGFHFFDVLVQLLFAGFFYRFLCRWLPSKTAVIAAVLYILYYVSAGETVHGQRDIYAVILFIVGISFLLPVVKYRWLNLVFAGLLIGYAVLIRPTWLLGLGVIAIFIAFADEARFSKSGILHGLAFFVFGLVPLCAVLIYYTSIPGGLDAFYNATIRFNLDIYAGLSFPGISPAQEFGRSIFLMIFAVVAVLPILRNTATIGKLPLRRPEAMLYAVCLISMIGIVLIQHKFFRYHLATFFIVMLPLAAVGIVGVASIVKSKLWRNFAIVVCCLLCSFVSYNPITPISFVRGLIDHADPIARAEEARDPSPVFGAKPRVAVLEFLNRPENKDGVVELCVFDPSLRVHLPRACTGTFVTFPMSAFRAGFERSSQGNEIPIYTNYQIAWRTAYMDTLRKLQPRFIILGREHNLWYLNDVYDDFLHFLPGFDSLLTTSYHYDTAFGGFQVFRRNGW